MACISPLYVCTDTNKVSAEKIVGLNIARVPCRNCVGCKHDYEKRQSERLKNK